MKKLIKQALYSTLIFLILLVSLLSFLLSTTPGLYTLIKLSTLYLPGTIKVHHLSGHLLNQFTIEDIDYQMDKTTIKIKQLVVNWQLKSLLEHQLLINSWCSSNDLSCQLTTNCFIFIVVLSI